MNYYIGDTHFGHASIITEENRPFSCVEEMDQTIIDNWNNKVTDTDKVYILGDFCCESEKAPEWYLSQLKGHKHLILGNHDKVILESLEARKFLESINQIRRIKDNARKTVMCHFPLAEWQGFDSGAVLFFAHLHDKRNAAYEYMKKLKAYNCGCPILNYTPCTFEEVIECNIVFRNEDKPEISADESTLSDFFPTVLKDNLKKRLIACRCEAGMTQKEVGALLGKSANAVASWEQGLSMPDIPTLYILSKHYNKTLEFMLGEDQQCV